MHPFEIYGSGHTVGSTAVCLRRQPQCVPLHRTSSRSCNYQCRIGRPGARNLSTGSIYWPPSSFLPCKRPTRSWCVSLWAASEHAIPPIWWRPYLHLWKASSSWWPSAPMLYSHRQPLGLPRSPWWDQCRESPHRPRGRGGGRIRTYQRLHERQSLSSLCPSQRNLPQRRGFSVSVLGFRRSILAGITCRTRAWLTRQCKLTLRRWGRRFVIGYINL